MPTFYFDIETTGLEQEKDKIVTIQFQELERNTGKHIGELVILKEWESSEKQILEEFLKRSRIKEHPFAFVPVGYNLGFEHKFLKERLAVHGLSPVDILNNPFIDIRSIGILMNNGELKGSGLDKISGKSHSGEIVPDWYGRKEYGKIVDYVNDEAAQFCKLFVWLLKEMPKLMLEFKKT